MATKKYRIKGKVIDQSSGREVPELKVEAWDKDLIFNDLVGSRITDDQGRFEMAFTNAQFQEWFFDRKPDLYFKVFQTDKEIHSTKDSVLWNYKNDDAELIIEIDLPAAIKISGEVINHKPEYEGLKILMYLVSFKSLNDYDKVEKLSDLEKEKGFSIIFESVLGEKASYEITVKLTTEKEILFTKGTNLIAYVADDEDLIVGRSPLIKYTEAWLKKGVDALDLSIEARKLLSIRTDEYFQVYSKLKDFLPELRVDEPRESNKIIYLLKDTGLNPDDLYSTVYAKNFVDQLGNLAEGKKTDYQELFFGLIKGSNLLISSHWDSVYSHLNEAKKYLRNAIKYDYIRKSLSLEVDTFIHYLENKVAEKVLEEDSDKLPIKNIISIAIPDKNKQQKYLTQRSKYAGDLTSFHKNLIKEKKFNIKEIQAIEFAGDLSDLTGGHIPLVEKLKAAGNRTKTIDLLKLNRDKLIEEITSVDLPEDLAKKRTDYNEDELKKNYAMNVVRGLERRFPSEVTLQYAKRKPEFVSKRMAENINTFFGKMKDVNKTFNLREHKIYDDDFKNEVKELKPEVVEDIKALQRIMFLAPDLDTTFKLLNRGITSVNQVAAMPEQVFISNFGTEFASPHEAREFHHSGTDFSFYLENIAVVGSASGSSTVTQMAGSKLLTDIPRDFCECEHCRSIFGPAAYFVELMQFLRNFIIGPLDVVDNDVQKPLLELLKRRPDLQHIELSCKNTSTLIPHIDLVNEVLEDIVVYGSLKKTDINSHSDGDIHIPHETGESTSEELLATPQHTLSPAYKKLSLAKYPASLPYHQPLDTIRTYLANLKTGRYELMSMINAEHDNTAIASLSTELKKEYYKKRNAIASEYIHLDEETFKSLTDKNFNEQNKTYLLRSLYGYTNNTSFKNNITNIREFLRRTNIKLTDLIDIVKTVYINPHLHLLEELNDILKPVTSGNLYGIDNKFSTARAEYNLIKILSEGIPVISENIPSTFRGAITATLEENLRKFFHAETQKANIGRIITLHQHSDLPENGNILDYMSINYIKKIYEGVDDDDLFETTFTKLHKFIRLWKKLGWTIDELDLAISALMDKNEDYFYPEFIRKISAVQQIKDLTNLKVEQILSFWSTINTRGENSLYKKLFLSKSISNIDTGFTLDDDNSLPEGKMEKHVMAIQAAYRISDADFNLIIKESGIDVSANNSFSIDNLTNIYRYVLLAKSFGLTIKEVIQLKTLCQIDPFGNWNNEYPLLAYLKQLDLINASAFNISELAKICGYDSSKDIHDDQVTQWIVETKEQLIKINAEYNPPAKEDIVEKALLISRFEQAISPQDLGAVLKTFEKIKETSEADINQLFNGIFANNWSEPVLLESEYDYVPVSQQEAFKVILKNNELYRYLLTELNNIIKPSVLAETFYENLNQLHDNDTSLFRQLLPEEQNNLLNHSISKSGLEIIIEDDGTNLEYKIQPYIHPPENGNYLISVRSKKAINSVVMLFDNEELSAQPIAIDQEVTFNLTFRTKISRFIKLPSITT